jgi:hypothetical protein
LTGNRAGGRPARCGAPPASTTATSAGPGQDQGRTQAGRAATEHHNVVFPYALRLTLFRSVSRLRERCGSGSGLARFSQIATVLSGAGRSTDTSRPLEPGDQVEGEGIGVLTNEVVAEPAR